MEKKLQTLIFPDNEKVQRQWGIYYRGNRCVQGKDDVKLYIPAFEVIDFSTFFNGFSYKKMENIYEFRCFTSLYRNERKF